MLTFEDFTVGRVFPMGPKQVTQEEIIAFAKKYDPQPFHTEPDSDHARSVGGLIASGWHSCGVLMRMICDAYLLDSASMGSPGLSEVRWLRPIRPGDTLYGKTTVIGRRVSQSRPELGLLTLEYELCNQNGEPVMLTRGIGMMRVARAGEHPVSEGDVGGEADNQSRQASTTDTAGSSGRSFYQLVQPGMTQETGSYTFEAEEIIDFASQFDPQAFHLSQEGAEQSHFGALCASGWHTIAVWMRINVLHGYSGLRKAAGYEGPPLELGPSPGVRNIKWPHPVFAGDTITFHSTVTGKRPGKTKGWGMMTSRSEGFNQDGVQVLSLEGAARMPMEG